MKLEKAQADFAKLIADNNFTLACITSDTNREVYHRVWKKKVQVAWQGEMDDVLEVRILLSYGIPLVSVIRNGKNQDFIRDYTSPKRAFNAIREMVTYAGFEM